MVIFLFSARSATVIPSVAVPLSWWTFGVMYLSAIA